MKRNARLDWRIDYHGWWCGRIYPTLFVVNGHESMGIFILTLHIGGLKSQVLAAVTFISLIACCSALFSFPYCILCKGENTHFYWYHLYLVYSWTRPYCPWAPIWPLALLSTWGPWLELSASTLLGPHPNPLPSFLHVCVQQWIILNIGTFQVDILRKHFHALKFL